MTHPFGDPSAQREHLGRVLRRLRDAAGLSGPQIAERIGISQSRASRIELGQQSVSVDVAQQWAQATGADETALAEVTELAEAAATQAVSWRKAAKRGLLKLQQDSREIEASATIILNFQPTIIPGLLQIPEYSRRVFAVGYPRPDQQEVAAAVAVRMDRQLGLYDESRRFEFLLWEAAMHWRPGPASIMRAQLDRIASVSALGNVTVGVIPLGVEADLWHDHGFNILDGRGDTGEPIVHVETLTTGVTLTDAEDVATYREVFGQLRAAAIIGDEATALMREVGR